MKNPKFEIFSGKSDKYYFRQKAKNGQIILSSQSYSSKAGCKNGIESVKNNATDINNFDVSEAKDGRVYFTLVAGNKEVIGKSEMYNSMAGCKNGIESVKENASAPVEDLT
jgi:uncharacterized protein YegP (UPF0339 family)